MTQQDKQTQPERAETTPTRFVHVREVRLAYRRFCNPAGTPLILLQHFRGSMDNWDPALLNGLARDRTVITFDNAGVGFSSGEVPDNVAAMAQDALDFLDALNLTQAAARALSPSIRRSLKRRLGLPPETGYSGSSLNQPKRARRQGRPSGIGCKRGQASAIRFSRGRGCRRSARP